MSFDEQVLRRLHRQVDTELVQLVDKGDSVKRRRFQKIATYAGAVGLHKGHATPRPVSKASGAGLDVLIWTLRTRPSATSLDSSSSASTGSSTDFPAVAVAARMRRAITAAA